MIKKSVFEDELIHGMQRELHSHEKKQGMQNLVKAADHLHSALEILEESGLTAQADKIFKILKKIANSDTKGLTSEKMVANLKNHGTVFNMANDGADQNNVDIAQPSSFEEDYKKWLAMKPVKKPKKKDIDPDLVGLIETDDSEADDLLNAEIGEDPLVVTEGDPEKTFEDGD